MSSSAEPALTLGTAGHIDHGKTVLVEALTGTNADRLPEEQERGISIELGFASLELPSGRRLSVVDVPGHERFVRSMVAGATGIDIFMLVVAADDGVMPQTREHLRVIETLAVPAGVVAVTKTDVAGEEAAALAVEEVEELLADGPYRSAPIVPVSAPTRRGLDRLLDALDDVARSLPGRSAAGGPPRLHVDRCFTLKGVGTVVTGTLWSGSLAAGDEVTIQPQGRRARIRAVEVHGCARDHADAGQRVALNLAAVERSEVERGDVVTGGDARPRPTYLMDAALTLAAGTPPLRRGARVHVHHGTRETPARIAPVEGDELEPGRRAYAQLRLERPIVALEGDRFVLRSVAPPDTIGGGVVLDPHPRKHGAGTAHVERLSLLEHGDPLARLEAVLAGARSGVGEGEADTALLQQLESLGRARRVGHAAPLYFAPPQLERSRASLLEALERTGTRPISRGALGHAAGISDSAAGALLDALVSEGAAVARGPGYAFAGAERDPRLEGLVEVIREDGLEPRSPEAAGEALGLPPTQALELLEQAALERALVRVHPGVYYHPGALAEAERVVVELCRREGAVTIAGLRDRLGTSRKYAQALLEHLDAARVTRRQGDEHVLRRAGADSPPVR
jgi:selenocysteine-specific elongation factor